MSKTKSRPHAKDVSKDDRWDEAIRNAEAEISEAQTRISGLRRSIASFCKLRDSGMEFPGRGETKARIA